jgi:hypothetical protein
MENAKVSIDLNEKQDDTDDALALQSYNEKSKSNSTGSSSFSASGAMDDAEKNVKSDKEATGGKRAWKTPGAEEGTDSRAQSLEMFRKHKREGKHLSV